MLPASARLGLAPFQNGVTDRVFPQPALERGAESSTDVAKVALASCWLSRAHLALAAGNEIMADRMGDGRVVMGSEVIRLVVS